MSTFTASLANHHNPQYIVETVEHIDASLSYDTFLIGDERLNYNTHALLALAAEHTEEIGLGTGVTNPYTRHPAMTAAAIATLDKLSDGRAKLGLGSGSSIGLDPLGYDQSDPVGTTRDAIKVIRRLLDGEQVSLDRPEFAVDDADLDVAPVSDVPVYVAGRGPHILGLGGFRGDGVLAGAGLASVDGMDYAREKINNGAEKAGRDLEEIDIVCWAFLSVAEKRDVALDGVNSLVGRIVNKAPLPALTAIGIDADLAKQVKAIDDVRALSDEELRTHIPREVTEQFAIAGTPAECREHVARLRDAGVDHIGVLAFDNQENDEQESLSLFSERVIDEVDG
jgi:5,10-methylenetetrahydromethanopterin reductase